VISPVLKTYENLLAEYTNAADVVTYESAFTF
jgi:hypothetical protein